MKATGTTTNVNMNGQDQAEDLPVGPADETAGTQPDENTGPTGSNLLNDTDKTLTPNKPGPRRSARDQRKGTLTLRSASRATNEVSTKKSK